MTSPVGPGQPMEPIAPATYQPYWQSDIRTMIIAMQENMNQLPADASQFPNNFNPYYMQGQIQVLGQFLHHARNVPEAIRGQFQQLEGVYQDYMYCVEHQQEPPQGIVTELTNLIDSISLESRNIQLTQVQFMDSMAAIAKNNQSILGASGFLTSPHSLEAVNTFIGRMVALSNIECLDSPMQPSGFRPIKQGSPLDTIFNAMVAMQHFVSQGQSSFAQGALAQVLANLQTIERTYT